MQVLCVADREHTNILSEISRRQNLDSKVRIDLPDDLDSIPIREVALL